MAVKGIVDTESYVVDGYQAPIDYFSPAESVSDYLLPQNYFTFSEPYVFASLQLSSAFTLGADPIYRRTIEEYTWDDFAESSIIDRTWDEWFGDRWDSGGVAFSFGIILDAAGGYLHFAEASLQAFNTTLNVSSRIAAGQLSVSGQTTIDVDAVRTRGGVVEITSAATQDTTGNFTAGGVGSITSAASIGVDPGAIFGRFIVTPSVVSSTDTTANATFSPSQTLTSVASTDATGNAEFIADATLNAFYSKLAVGRLISLPDPFNTIKVAQEIRTFVVTTENRTIDVLQESRVNTVVAEQRQLKVDQETRNYKIFRPGFTDRTSIPRVRSET